MNQITVPRIAFAVVTFLIILGFVKGALFPGDGKEEGMISTIMTLVTFSLSCLMTLIGSSTIVWNRVKARPLAFWITATALAATPVILVITNLICFAVSGREFMR